MAVELTTVVGVNERADLSFAELAERLDGAVPAAIVELGMGDVSAYFVTPDWGTKHLQVGLRFERMDPQHIESVADEILELAFKIAASGESSGTSDVRRLRSQLVSA